MTELSVIVPIYNVGDDVLTSMQSLCRQTSSDFELILVDDGSSDDSVSRAENYLTDQNRNYTIIHQANRGLAAARNTGTIAAHGEWITWLDADDEFAYNTVEAVRNLFSSDVDAIFLSFTNCNFVETVLYCGIEKLSSDELRDEFLFRKKKLLAPGTFLRKEFLLNHNLFYKEGLRYSEDADFLWRLLLSGKQWVLLKGSYYHYVIRQNSIMNGGSSVENILSGIQDAISIDVSHSDYKYKELISPRWVLGLLHSAARQLPRDDFQKLISAFDYKTQMKRLGQFPEKKTVLLSKLLLLSPMAFYSVARRF